jgi:hypothetical protein
MMMAFDFAERKTGLQANRDRGRIHRRMFCGIEHLRRNAVAVRHGVGRCRAPAATVGPQVDVLHHGCRIVTRSDHHRHPQREFISRLMNGLLIFDLHEHGFAGADIGDRVGEDVRPLLLGECSLLSVPLCLLVDDAGLLPFPDLADDDAVADHHFERVDRATGRQRIDIGRLHPALGRIPENLRDAGADRRTGHGEVDIDAEPCRVGVAVIGFEEQGAGARVAGPGKIGVQAVRGPCRLKAQK